MDQLVEGWRTIRLGGPIVYPLIALGFVSTAIIFDRAIAFRHALSIPRPLREILRGSPLRWDELASRLDAVNDRHGVASFLRTIVENRNRAEPIWWIESRARAQAGRIERDLARGLWILETTVTAAPLLGLLGTIAGMIQAFEIVGVSGLVAPTKVSAGVAQALIATALGLAVAVVALFAFNLFSRIQSRALDEIERIGSHLIDELRQRLEREKPDDETALTPVASARPGRENRANRLDSPIDALAPRYVRDDVATASGVRRDG